MKKVTIVTLEEEQDIINYLNYLAVNDMLVDHFSGKELRQKEAEDFIRWIEQEEKKQLDSVVPETTRETPPTHTNLGSVDTYPKPKNKITRNREPGYSSPVTPWKDKEEEQLTFFTNTNISPENIGKRMGRSTNSIKGKSKRYLGKAWNYKDKVWVNIKH